MDINRRALYNSLRMNWVLNPKLEVEAWQIEDYRSMPLDTLFEKLEDLGLPLDKTSLVGYAENVDSPEDLTDFLLADFHADPKIQDQVYLLVFELWRRLLPEKPCISVLCDEIDHQIHLYDRGQTEKVEDIQDALANLQVILDENTDAGADPVKAFKFIDAGCANDLESFLYDFISEQIDSGNYSYASELLDGFSIYVPDIKWFEFLHARILSSNDPEEANLIVRQLIEDKKRPPDLAFNLELLSFLVSIGDRETFESMAKKTADFLETEEDFQNVVSICADFYHRLDHEQQEHELQAILNKRENYDLDKSFDRKDPQFSEFSKIISKK